MKKQKKKTRKIKAVSKNGQKRSRKKLTKVGKIDPGLYWKWRASIEAMEHEQTRVLLCQAQRNFHGLEVEIASLKMGTASGTLKRQNDAVKMAQMEYDDLTREIEGSLKISLANCSIDPQTFEVTKSAK